eukprot:TRINITY_DN7344_c0_g1_i2.p1 TRINITY_DN7344_c0_g1~~TRINITY_DN7344_c0_g1_i2.p1  ORF type:complete len:367 (-),score=49.77 TRINITY_DN7344_c0_g1_i2:263-1363(-)
MDGNKDEGLKCLRIGQEALEIGDKTRALKFFNKARRLDPTLPVDDLISSLNAESVGDPTVPDSTVPNGASSHSNSFPRVRVSSTGSSASSSSSSSSASKSYTEEQITIVRQIKKQKDYYEILGLEKACSVEDVRKAYRKLSLKVHPDKNKAPGSEEAFKKVSKAFQCLSSEESRKQYDLVGSDEPVYERTVRRRTHNYNGYYDVNDVDAEEIFRNFFFGGMAPATTQFGGFRFRTGGVGPGFRSADAQVGSGNFNIRALVQILPVILLLLLNFLPSSDPVYMLSRSYPYEHRFVTERNVPYFVKSARFEQEYPPQSAERRELEEHVERDYFSILTQNCRLELQRRTWGRSYPTPHCDMLKDFEAVA